MLNPTFAYDANGNLTTGAGRTITWTSFNIPSAITSCPGNVAANCKSTSFWYNPEHERTKELQADQSVVITLSPRYDTGLHWEKKYVTNAAGVQTGAVEYEHYLYAGGLMFGKFIQNTQTDGVTIASSSYEYYTKDHLGSIVAITDGTGTVIQRLSYDVWGKRRYPNGTADPNGLLNNPDMYHGYTGHEMLDSVALIHMNGRLYDPMMARFISADPNIPNSENLLSYSRYTYCLDNPLACTDPSGYFDLGDVFKVAAVVAIGVYMAPMITNSLFLSAINPALAAGTLTTAQVTTAWTMASAISGAVVGFTSSMIMTGGNLEASAQGALLGGLSGGLFGAVGLATEGGTFANYAGHAGAGCLIGMANGSGCGRGAASELTSKGATILTQGSFVASVIAGGTVSAIGGGKFGNGAVTAAFGYFYNFCTSASEGCIKAWVTNALKVIGGGMGMMTGGGLCAGGVTCAAGGPMIAIGANELYEGADWIANGNEGTRGENPLRDGLRKGANKLGLPAAAGESLYYSGAAMTNIKSAVVNVSKAVPSSVGWLTIDTQRYDTLSNIQRASLYGATAGNVYKAANPAN